MSRHLVRINAPRTWKIPRKTFVFITKPRGSHKTSMGLPLLTILRDILQYVKTSAEAKKVVQNEEILVDGKRVKDTKRIIGLFDILSIQKLKENYRIYINKKGKIALQKTSDNIKPCKIIGKTLVNGKVQLNLYDGSNFFADNSYKVGDTVVLETLSKKILHHFKLEKGSVVYIMGGNHLGDFGIVESVSGSNILCRNNEGQVFVMPKYYAFVIGKDKAVITI